MAFTSINTGIIAVGKAITNYLMTMIKDNFDALNGTIETLAVQIKNGSFETDSDADGIPDSWTRNVYPAGTVERTTTPAEVAHGQAAIKMVHPGGVNNGGGALLSDYIVCTPFESMILGLVHWCTAAGMKNIINVKFYDSAKVALSNPDDLTELYNSTANPTTATALRIWFVPPAGARFYRLELIGGYTDTDVAGTAYFDGIVFNPFIFQPQPIGKSISITQKSTSLTAWTDVASIDLQIASNLPCRLIFTAQVTGVAGTGTGQCRFRIGSDYSNDISKTADGYGSIETMTLDLTTPPPATVGVVTLTMQLNTSDSGFSIYGKMDANLPTRRILNPATLFD